MSESITETDGGDIILTTMDGLYDASIRDGDLVFHARYVMDSDFSDTAIKRAANGDVELTTCVDFSALELVGVVKTSFVGFSEYDEQDALRTPMMMLRSQLLDCIKEIDTLFKVSPPHLLLFPGNTPPAVDLDPGAH